MMRRHARTVFLICLSLALVLPSAANGKTDQSENRQPTFEISLLTFSPTDNLFEWFGHTALAVTDRRSGKSTAYNFGGFSFGTDDFLMFTMGRFVFWSYTMDTSRVIKNYRRRGRHILIQKLDLTRRQTTAIRHSLMRSMLPSNRHYVYDHFKDNCATRLRDIVDDALDGAIRNQSGDLTGKSYRDYVHRMTAHLPTLNFLVNFILSDGVDHNVSYWDTMFLPDRLMDVFQHINNPETGRPLVKSRNEIISTVKSLYYTDNAAIPSTVTRDLTVGIIQFLVLCLSAGLFIRRRAEVNSLQRKLYPALVSLFGAAYGLLGVVLFFMAVIGSHKDVYWNENFFLLNPATLLLLPLGVLQLFGKASRFFNIVSMACGAGAVLALFLKILPNFDQANLQQLIVLLPCLIVIGVCGVVEYKRSVSV